MGPAREAPNNARPGGSLALAATVRAAAPQQRARRAEAPFSAPRLDLREEDLRYRRREPPAGRAIVFVVDASGSMAAERLMAVAKGAVRNLLIDAYQRRDRAALIAFRGAGAELLLAPTGNVELAERALRELPTGGRTPLAHGIQLAREVASGAARSGSRALVVFLSDGRANVPLHSDAPLDDAYDQARRLREARVQALVLDSETGGTRLGLAERLAAELGAEYQRLQALDEREVEGRVRATLATGA